MRDRLVQSCRRWTVLFSLTLQRFLIESELLPSSPDPWVFSQLEVGDDSREGFPVRGKGVRIFFHEA